MQQKTEMDAGQKKGRPAKEKFGSVEKDEHNLDFYKEKLTVIMDAHFHISLGLRRMMYYIQCL